MDEKTPTTRLTPQPAERPGSISFRLSLRPARLIAALIVGTLILTVFSLIANIMGAEQMRGAQSAIELFSVDKEGSLPTWWAVVLLASVGGLTLLVASNRKSASLIEKFAWLMLAAGFIFLSADEACMLHERIGSKVQLQGSLHHARWIFLWLPPAVLIGGAVLFCLWRASKRLVLGITLGAIIFLSGAVGTEMFNASYRYHQETLDRQAAIDAQEAGDITTAPRDWRIGATYYPYIFGTVIEEFLEAIGPIIWIAVLLSFHREQTTETQHPTTS